MRTISVINGIEATASFLQALLRKSAINVRLGSRIVEHRTGFEIELL